MDVAWNIRLKLDPVVSNPILNRRHYSNANSVIGTAL